MKTKGKILAVDDEHDVLLFLRTVLEPEGYRVLTSPGGADALQTARNEQPDLILLDVMMPEMNGFEVLDKLRRDDATRSIPVVMVTVVSDRESKKTAISRGVKYYLTKPYDVHDLVAKVAFAIQEDTDPDFD